MSTATNLYPLDANGAKPDVFVTNLATGDTSIVARNENGEQGNGYAINLAWLGDSKHLVFQSQASNLVPDDTNKTWDLFAVTFR